MTALCSLITESVNSDKKCIAVFLDLKKAKAFDTLMKTLDTMGIMDIALDSFNSYLQNRKQIMSIGV